VTAADEPAHHFVERARHHDQRHGKDRAMTIATPRPRLSILTSELVFNLPERVALEEGLFERAGLDVVVEREIGYLSKPHDFIADPTQDPLHLFKEEKVDSWNMCEWGVIHRVEITEARNARIAYLRPAVVAQAIISFRPDLQEPHDLADVPVGMVETTGQHYNTLQILEGTLRRDQIQTVHGGSNLLDKARNGTFAAVTTMEPYISLGLKQGAHIIALNFYRGGQIFADSIDDQTRRTFVRTLNEAVDLINAKPERHRRTIVEPTNGQLAPDELREDYFRYTHAVPFTEKRFEESYAWMQSWGLADGSRDYASVIEPVAM
jgi:NitT/TauT family transport system substrate-binding protein